MRLRPSSAFGLLLALTGLLILALATSCATRPVSTTTSACIMVLDSVKVKGTNFTQTVLAKDFAADSTDAEGVVAGLDSTFTPLQRRLVHRTVAHALAQRPRLLPGAVLALRRGGIHVALRQDSTGNLVLVAGRDAQVVKHSYVREINTTVLSTAPKPPPLLARLGGWFSGWFSGWRTTLALSFAGLLLLLLLLLRLLK